MLPAVNSLPVAQTSIRLPVINPPVSDAVFDKLISEIIEYVVLLSTQGTLTTIWPELLFWIPYVLEPLAETALAVIAWVVSENNLVRPKTVEVAALYVVSVLTTVSVAVTIPVMCPYVSSVISWMYVLPELFELAWVDVSEWLNTVPVKSNPAPLEYVVLVSVNPVKYLPSKFWTTVPPDNLVNVKLPFPVLNEAEVR